MKNFKSQVTDLSRRSLIKKAGAAGALLAVSGFLPLDMIKPEGDLKAAGSFMHVENIASLLAIDVRSLGQGKVIIVGGYFADGDGGGKTVIWDPECVKQDNGGTVHDPFRDNSSKGRFLTLHSGTGDYRWFGIFDETKAADDAFLAMVYDESIVCIEAHSNLLFKRRNRITRSRVTLDFKGYTVYTYGIEKAKVDDPFGTVFFFTGETAGKVWSHTLERNMPEYWDVYEVADATKFAVGEWYTLICNTNDVGSENRELEKMTCVTEIVDSKHVRFDYKLGWPLEAGRRIDVQLVKPVFDVTIQNMLFEGNGRPTTRDAGNGSNPISFEYAVRCDVKNVHGKQVFWPLIERRYNSYYATEKCSLYNPVEVQVGGTGYLTQQIYCLYGTVSDCHASKTRHLNDFTGSAYCEVKNCHATGDHMGPFVTHGQYEHDLTYIGNSGSFGLAGSGEPWGESARGIVIKKQVGTGFGCSSKVTDVTIEDVRVFIDDYSGGGYFFVNCDGAMVKNCSAEKMLTLSCRSMRTKRRNVFEGCTFNAVNGRDFVNPYYPLKQKVTFIDCNFYGLSGNRFSGDAPLEFINCRFQGADATSQPIQYSSSEVKFSGCTFKETGILLAADIAQRLIIDGCEFTGASLFPRIDFLDFNAPVAIDISKTVFAGTREEDQFIKIPQGTKVSYFKITDSELSGGFSSYAADMMTPDGILMVRGCIESDYDRGVFPLENLKIKHSDNLYK